MLYKTMLKTKYILTYVFAISLSAALAGSAIAQEKKKTNEAKPEIKQQVLKKEIVGEVAGISGNFIAIDYREVGKTVYELALTMDKNTKFSRKGLKEIAIGDLVAVRYEETIEVKEGQKPKTLKRLAKVVEFRQPSKIQVDTETGVLESR